MLEPVMQTNGRQYALPGAIRSHGFHQVHAGARKRMQCCSRLMRHRGAFTWCVAEQKRSFEARRRMRLHAGAFEQAGSPLEKYLQVGSLSSTLPAVESWFSTACQTASHCLSVATTNCRDFPLLPSPPVFFLMNTVVRLSLLWILPSGRAWFLPSLLLQLLSSSRTVLPLFAYTHYTNELKPALHLIS